MDLDFDPNDPNYVSEVNRRFSQKCKAIDEAIDIRDWRLFLLLHERPFRLEALIHVEDRLSDNEF